MYFLVYIAALVMIMMMVLLKMVAQVYAFLCVEREKGLSVVD